MKPSSSASSASTSDGSCCPSRSQSTTATFSSPTDTTQMASPSMSNASTIQSSCKNCPTAISSASSLAPSDSASNYDPAVARLNLPKNVIAQLEKLVAKKPRAPIVASDPNAPTHGMKIRFYTSLIVLVTLGLLGLMANSLGVTKVTGVLVAGASLFAVNWLIVHGTGLSRHRRTYFNEKNVLDTYQIYDRDFGHLFQKEPDTPGGCCGPPPLPGDPNVAANPVQNVANDLLAKFKAPPIEKAEFKEAVQNHYGNMYDNIRRINQEMDLMAKAKQANSQADLSGARSSASSPSDPALALPQSQPLVPADIPLPGAAAKASSNKVTSPAAIGDKKQ